MSKKCGKIKPGALVRYCNPHWDYGTAVVVHCIPNWTSDEGGYPVDGVVVRWLDDELVPTTTEYPWDLELISE